MRKKKPPNREEVIWKNLARAEVRRFIKCAVFWCLLGVGLGILIGYYLVR